MEKLELKHLAPYLPYGLKFYDLLNEITHNVVGIIEDEIYAKEVNGDCYSWYYKESDELPILRPLSDLTKEIEFNGEKFVFMSKIKESQHHLFFREDIKNPILSIQYSEMQKLLSWHFDVFGLIEKGLAININTL